MDPPLENRVRRAVERTLGQLWGVIAQTTIELAPFTDEVAQALAKVTLGLIIASVESLGGDAEAAQAFRGLPNEEQGKIAVDALRVFVRRRQEIERTG